MKHHLVVIGSIAQRRAYLDVSRDEAIARYLRWCSEVEHIDPRCDLIDEIEFDDEFGVYDAWGCE